jgi:hypothetical protein
MKKSTPPKIALAFFRWFCQPEYREDLEGDLLERFHKNASQQNIAGARLLFIKDILLLFRPGIIRGFSRKNRSEAITSKKFNWLKFAVMNLLLVIVIMLQFLPGPPNKIILGLSILAQCAGFFGLVLVPVGAAWLLLEFIRLHTGNHYRKLILFFAITATVIITALILLFLLLIYFALDETLLAILALAPVMVIFRQVIKGIKALKKNTAISLHRAPLYLITIPLLSFLTDLYLIEPASEFSRDYAIQKSEKLIASIEEYKVREGQYPESFDDLKGTYLEKVPNPSVMGIQGFRYNKINDSYSLSFSQWLDWGSLEEIVLYDKNDLHKKINRFIDYDYSLDLYRVNGAFAIHDTGHDEWTYYHCD